MRARNAPATIGGTTPTAACSSLWPRRTRKGGHEHHPGRDRLRDEIAGHLLLPRHLVRRRVGGAGHDAVGVGRNRRMGGRGVGPDHAVVGDRGAQGVERRLVGASVVHLRVRALLGRPDRDVVTGDDLRGRVERIVEIGHLDRVGRAHDDARRLEVLLDAVIAEVALVGRVGLGVDVDRVVGTCVHAALAADAVVVVEVDHAVGRAVEGVGRADRHARGVVAVIAPHHGEVPAHVRERAGLDVLDPRAVDSERDVVLALAGDGAGVAADAGIAVEQEAESGHRSPVGRSGPKCTDKSRV